MDKVIKNSVSGQRDRTCPLRLGRTRHDHRSGIPRPTFGFQRFRDGRRRGDGKEIARKDQGAMTREEFRYKQSIVLRTDLRMSVGKLVAQACHASLESAERARNQNRAIWDRWRREGAKKVVLQVSSLADITTLATKARRFEVPHRVIEDRGLTEVPPGTVTAIAIGPAGKDLINKITGNLKLY